jgi:hypothetical protein
VNAATGDFLAAGFNFQDFAVMRNEGVVQFYGLPGNTATAWDSNSNLSCGGGPTGGGCVFNAWSLPGQTGNVAAFNIFLTPWFKPTPWVPDKGRWRSMLPASRS